MQIFCAAFVLLSAWQGAAVGAGYWRQVPAQPELERAREGQSPHSDSPSLPAGGGKAVGVAGASLLGSELRAGSVEERIAVH